MIMSGRGGVNGGAWGGGSRFPFTASQWQELEHQALIFKYIVSGVPIPPDLLFTIRRSSLLDSKQQQLFSHPAPPGPAPPNSFGWNCFQMGGLGMRKIDPEPGRCRRTDGKKWRCSEEAYQDSKYCEKHMHRGKNRSRKPVEQSIIISNNNNKPVSASSYSHHSSLTSDNHHLHPAPAYNNPYSSKVDSTHLILDSASYYNRTKYNNSNGLKEDVDEQCFFNKASVTTVKGFATGDSSMDANSWQLTPLAINSKQNGHQMAQDHSEHHQPPQQQEKTVYRFLEEWPPENNKAATSWLNLDDHHSSSSSSSSTTQLSISSIPAATSHHFFPISRNQNDG